MSDPRRSQPLRLRRSKGKSISYREDSSDGEVTDENYSRNCSRRPRPLRSTQKPHNYNEDGAQENQDESDSTESSISISSDLQNHRSQKRKPTAALKHKRKREAPQRPTQTTRSSFSSFKRQKISTTAHPTDTEQKVVVADTVNPDRRPLWQNLEYQILSQILRYAAYPLYESASRPSASISWLLQVSVLCRSFHDAALAALLYSPPLLPSFQAHALLDLLRQPQDSLSTNYRNKIKRLDVEVKQLLVKKSGIDLTQILMHTPLLKDLRLYHAHDEVGNLLWAQPSISRKNWTFSAELLDALDLVQIALTDFEWNGRFPETRYILRQLSASHTRPCLQNLQRLSLLNLSMLEKCSEQETIIYEDMLAAGLEGLRHLKELMFRSCGIVNERLLAKLPGGLSSLAFFNCPNLTSTALSALFSTHGSQLTELILNSNQALDLGFAPSLEGLCPNLEVFVMDLTYTACDPTSFHDVEPHYEELLPNGQPTWPRALRVIDLANLRNIDAQEADAFFTTLVDAACELRDLRRLSLKAILKVGWRDRASLRQKWKTKFNEVFSRTASPPSSTQNSMVRRERKPANFRIMVPGPPDIPRSVKPHSDDTSVEGSEPFAAATQSNRKSARIALKELESLAVTAAEEESSPEHRTPVDKQSEDESITSGCPHVHGMCDEVTFRIDDQRPAESQFNETDFLDDELSGDEDWTGSDPIQTKRYAW